MRALIIPIDLRLGSVEYHAIIVYIPLLKNLPFAKISA